MHIYISLGSEYTNLPQIIIPCKERAIFGIPFFLSFLITAFTFAFSFGVDVQFKCLEIWRSTLLPACSVLSQRVAEANKVPQAPQLTTKLFDTTICKSLQHLHLYLIY